MAFEYWWKYKRNKIAEPAEDKMTHMVYKQCWEESGKEERKKWAKWIGDVLTVKHPEYSSILWAIAEAIERDNFGVKVQTND